MGNREFYQQLTLDGVPEVFAQPLVRDVVYGSPIPGLMLIKRPTYNDRRGYFHELYYASELMEALGYPFEPQQANFSLSIPGVLRGLHPEGWNKLVTIVSGKAYCVWVDFRRGSSTFGQRVSVILAHPGWSIYVPEGVGNSMCVMGDEPVHYLYLVDKEYSQRNPEWDRLSVSPFDPELGIEWPVENPIISERDVNAISFAEMRSRLGM